MHRKITSLYLDIECYFYKHKFSSALIERDALLQLLYVAIISELSPNTNVTCCCLQQSQIKYSLL